MSEQSYPSPLYAWYVVMVLLFGMIVSLIDRMVIALLIVPIQTDIPISDTEMGWILGVAFGLFYSLAGLPIGRLVDRFNRVHIISLGAALWILATFASGMANSFWHLFLARMGVGVGEAVLAPAGWSLIVDLFPAEKRARALSTFQLGAVSGTGLGFLLGGIIYSIAMTPEAFTGTWFQEIEPWRTVFIFAAAPGVLLLLLMTTIRDPRKVHTLANHSPVVTLADVYGFLVSQGRVLLFLFLGMGLIIMLIYSVSSWVPTYIARKFDVSSGEIGHLLGLVILLTALPGVILGGWITDKWVARGDNRIYLHLLLAGGMLTVLPLILLPFAPNITILLACIGAFFFMATLPNGVLVAYIQRVTPPTMRGTVGACYVLAVNMVGYLLGPTSVGFISETLLDGSDSIGLALAAMGLFSCVLASGIFFLSRDAALHLLAGSSEPS